MTPTNSATSIVSTAFAVTQSLGPKFSGLLANSTQSICLAGLILVATLFSSGCTRTVPSYLNESNTISSYLDKATKVDYPDVAVPSLDEVTQAHNPITVIDSDFQSYYDLTLEDAISYGLNNGKVMRGYGTPTLQGNRINPGIDNIVNSPNAAGTIWNIAVRETEPGFIGTPGQIANPGSISTNTGLDVNQGVESALAEFDAYYLNSLNFTKSDEPRNTVPNNQFTPLVFQQDQWSLQTEVGKKTAGGTQVFFRNSSGYFDNNNPLSSQTPPGLQVLDSWYRTSFEAEVRQPLLRGRGEFINRMPIVVSRIGTDQEIANLEAQLQNFITNIELRYWDLYVAYRNLDAAKKGRNAALETWKIVKDQFDEGAEVNIQQVAQAAQQFHSFNTQVTEAFNNVLTAQNQLRFLIGWSATDGAILRPVDEPVMAQIEFSWCESLCEALTYRPELRQERWEIKKRELALAYAKNGLLPELNATALYRWLGLGNKFGTSGDSVPFPDATSGALNELFGGNYQEIVMGIDFRMPIGYRRELANVRNAQLKLAREIGRLEDMELDVTKELTEAFQHLALNQQVLQHAWDRWRYVKMEEEHFKLLQDAGVERLDVALDAQQRLAQIEITFYNALAEYNKSIALIHRRKGTALSYAGIEFAEGPWTGKAYLDAQEHARRRAASREVNYGWTRPQVISQGEQSSGTGNVGHPLQGRVMPSTTNVMHTPVDNVVPMEIPNDEAVPPAESINSQPLPSPTKTQYQRVPTPAKMDSTQVIRDDQVQAISYAEPVQQAKPKANAAGKTPSRYPSVAEPARHEPKSQVRELPGSAASSSRSSIKKENRENIVINTTTSGFTNKLGNSIEEAGRMERLGLNRTERDSVEGDGNVAKIQIGN